MKVIDLRNLFSLQFSEEKRNFMHFRSGGLRYLIYSGCSQEDSQCVDSPRGNSKVYQFSSRSLYHP